MNTPHHPHAIKANYDGVLSKDESATLPTPTDRLLAERGEVYGEAWILTGEVADYLHQNASHAELLDSGYYYAWITILGKLIRLIRSPYHLDTWRDIIGWATLAANHIERHGDGK